MKLFTAFLTAASILGAATANPKGNDAKGRFYYKQTCKTCHTKGAKGGEVTPMSKTQAQWKLYFVKAKHNSGTEALLKVMPEEQLRDVQTFLVNHAVDSPQPETCGK
ncbi:MAG: cytochrome c [Acidobacteria bacterium]|nr:cytochrome c [Acidobacteriota bacterium]